MAEGHEELSLILMQEELNYPENLPYEPNGSLNTVIEDTKWWHKPEDCTELLLIAARNGYWNVFQDLFLSERLVTLLLNYGKYEPILTELNKIEPRKFYEYYVRAIQWVKQYQSQDPLINQFAEEFLAKYPSLEQFQSSDEVLGEDYKQTCKEFTAIFLHTVLMIGLLGGKKAEVELFDSFQKAKDAALIFADKNDIQPNDAMLIVNTLLDIFRTAPSINEKELQNIISGFKLKVINTIATLIDKEKELLQPLKKSTLFLAAMTAINRLFEEIKYQDKQDYQGSIAERFSHLFLKALGVHVKEEAAIEVEEEAPWEAYFSDGVGDGREYGGSASNYDDWDELLTTNLSQDEDSVCVYDSDPGRYLYGEGIQQHQSFEETITAQLRIIEENILLGEDEKESCSLTHILENYVQWPFSIAFTLVIAASNNLDNVFDLLLTNDVVLSDINEIWQELGDIDKHTNSNYVNKCQIAINGQPQKHQDPGGSQGYSFLNIPIIQPNPIPFMFNQLAQAIKFDDQTYYLQHMDLQASKLKGDKGNTLLHLAVKYKNARAFDVLVNLGADLHAKNQTGNTVWVLIKKICNKKEEVNKPFLHEISKSIYGVLQEGTPGWIMSLQEESNNLSAQGYRR